jgi:hypothetical protein
VKNVRLRSVFAPAILLVAIAAAPAPAAETSPRLFSGVVSDSECGLADHATGEVYQIDDQKAVR